jgi:Lar family restriction alleviation protein
MSEKKYVLLPCPFCGSHDIQLGSPINADGPECMFNCNNCDALGPNGMTVAEAIAAWNRRVSPYAVDLNAKSEAVASDP